MRTRRNQKNRKNRLLKYGSLALAAAAGLDGAGAGVANAHASTQTSDGQPGEHSQAASSASNVSTASEGMSQSTSDATSQQNSSSNNAKQKQAQQPAKNVDPQFGPLAGHPSAQIIAVTYGYQIQSGDNLPSIAAVHHVSQASIVADNPGVNFDHLIAGTQLRIQRTSRTAHHLGFTFTKSGVVVNTRSSRPPKDATLQFGRLGAEAGAANSTAPQSTGSASMTSTQTDRDLGAQIPTANAQNSSRQSLNWNDINQQAKTVDNNQPSAAQPNKVSQLSSSIASSMNADAQSTQAKSASADKQSAQERVNQLHPTQAQQPRTIYEHQTDFHHVDQHPEDQVAYHLNQPQAPVQNNYGLDAQNEAAMNWIVRRESGGNYYARNGHMIGKYQLTDTYLHGNYSKQNQDATAQHYVNQRYGNWVNAKSFWAAHHWY